VNGNIQQESELPARHAAMPVGQAAEGTKGIGGRHRLVLSPVIGEMPGNPQITVDVHARVRAERKDFISG